jgi:hypothetical protein
VIKLIAQHALQLRCIWRLVYQEAEEIMSVRAQRATRRSLYLVVAATVLTIGSAAAFGQVSSLNLDFNGGGGGVLNTGFESAYNPDASGVLVNNAGNGKLGILTQPGDTFGNYENDPDTAKNFFYTNFNVGDRAVLEARVNALNLNENFHGGGIWMGTDQDHYIRLGLINNGFEPQPTGSTGNVVVEALRENEDRWPTNGVYPNRPGFDIEGRSLGIADSSTATVGGAPNGRDVTAILRLVRDHHAVAAYVSTDNGATFRRVGGDTYSFNALATDATSLPIDNRTVADPNNADKTSHTVEPGFFKVGAYALGGGSSGAVIQFDSLSAITGTPTYTGAAVGEWTTNSNWNNNNGVGAPTNIESTAVFPTTGSARTITVATPITATNVRFESAAGTTVSGAGEVRFDWFFFPTHPNYYTDGPGTVTVSVGSHTISAPSVVVHLHNFDVASGAMLTLSNMTASPVDNLDAGVRKLGVGTMAVNHLLTPTVNVQAGTLRVTANGTATGVSTVQNITVVTTAGSTAKLDLTNNSAIVEYGVSPAVSPLDGTTALIKSGYNGGTQAGAGIISSTAIVDGKHALGIAEASDLVTVPALFGTVDSTAVLIRYTLKGDANIDGGVDFADLVRLAQNYNSPAATRWFSGDFDYDGDTDFQDLIPLAQNYNLSAAEDDIATIGGSDFAADWALAQSLVPEPTSLVALSMLGGALVRHRRV